MEINLFTYDCTGCGKCAACCPRKILEIIDNGICRFASAPDETRCAGCKKCERICPEKAIVIKRKF